MPAERRKRYQRLILDCDGVLFDTNRLKESNIRAAASIRCDGDKLERFVRYFTDHNGVPREAKIRTWFPDDGDAAPVLDAYNALNRDSLAVVEPLTGALAFVRAAVKDGFDLYVLSGGAQHEVRALIERSGMSGLFAGVFGGPDSKHGHLARLALCEGACYFGDSMHDYEVARDFGFDFVFLWRYTQADGWKAFFADKPEVRVRRELEPQHVQDLCYE